MKLFFLSTSLVTLIIGNAIAQIDYTEVAFEEYTVKDKVPSSYPAFLIKQLKNKVRSYPNRLDYRLEYLNELAVRTEWNRFSNEVINLIEFSYQSHHDWTWTTGYDAIGEDPEGFLLDTVEDYVFMLYITGEPAQFDHLRSICEVVLEYNPHHLDFLTYPAMTYDALGAYRAGQAYLFNAEKSHPDSALIKLLIAENYEHQGMIKAALAYYKKAAILGTDDDVQEAVAHIDRLSFK